MPPGNFKRKWIKLWIDECLTGTIREDLTVEERSVWYDFLLVAGRNRPPGSISANEDTPMSLKRLAAILNISTKLLAQAIDRFMDSGRITKSTNDIIHISNWAKYQFTDYDRQKPYRKNQAEKAIAFREEQTQYLLDHPEEVSGSVTMEGYEYTEDDRQADETELFSNRSPEHKAAVEEHEAAMYDERHPQ